MSDISIFQGYRIYKITTDAVTDLKILCFLPYHWAGYTISHKNERGKKCSNVQQKVFSH
jgi:hypothetical protein